MAASAADLAGYSPYAAAAVAAHHHQYNNAMNGNSNSSAHHHHHHHNAYSLASAERLMRATVDPLSQISSSFGHHHQSSPGSNISNSNQINGGSSTYDPSRAYTEYAASYYAASRHVLGSANNNSNSNNGSSSSSSSSNSSAGSSINSGIDTDSLHSTFYRNGLFSAAAAAAAANSSDNSMLFRVSGMIIYTFF
jgi:hypothetical protein